MKLAPLTALAAAIVAALAAQPAQALRMGGGRHVLARNSGAGRLTGEPHASHRSSIYSLYLDNGRR